MADSHEKPYKQEHRLSIWNIEENNDSSTGFPHPVKLLSQKRKNKEFLKYTKLNCRKEMLVL